MTQIFESPPWQKYRSTGYGFLATDADFDDVLRTALAQQFAPYSLIRVVPEKKENSRFYTQNFVETPVERYLAFRGEYPTSPVLWLMSRKLTPSAILRKWGRLDASLAINGLIGFSPQWVAADGSAREAYIRMNWAIICANDDTVHKHMEYRKVFNAVKRAFQQLLVYEVGTPGTSGSPAKIRNLFMSERFARDVEAGLIQTVFRPCGNR